MASDRFPVTPAVRALRTAGVDYEPHLYDYEAHGGTARAAAELGVDEHGVLKTIVLEDERGKALIFVQHGDQEVAVGLLARAIGAKRVSLCAPEVALKHTGYLVGGTSPLGTRGALPVYVQASVAELDRVFVNGGKRGFLVRLSAADLIATVNATLVDAAA